MIKTVFIFIISSLLFLSSNIYAQSEIEQQFELLQNAILQRDEIIKKMIKRIELLEGEVVTIKNKEKIRQIVEDSFQNETDPGVESVEETVTDKQIEVDESEVTLADQVFERQLLDRGGLVLPVYASVVDVGLTMIHSSTDNIIIDGFTIDPVLVVGDIFTQRVRKNTTQLALGWRIGLPDNLQFEASVPWNYVNISRVEADSDEETFYDTGLGDIELGLSYQLFHEHEWMADSLLAVRWKTTSGDGPYEYSDPENHSTGSGFDALNMYYTAVTVDDPLAYYGSISYTYNFEDRKDIGRIKPGDTFGFTLGTSLAINFKSSWNFGYSQSWTQKTELDNQQLSGTRLITSTLNLGFNYTIDNRRSMNTTLGIGLTEDSPDFQLGINVPMRFGL